MKTQSIRNMNGNCDLLTALNQRFQLTVDNSMLSVPHRYKTDLTNNRQLPLPCKTNCFCEPSSTMQPVTNWIYNGSIPFGFAPAPSAAWSVISYASGCMVSHTDNSAAQQNSSVSLFHQVEHLGFGI